MSQDNDELKISISSAANTCILGIAYGYSSRSHELHVHDTRIAEPAAWWSQDDDASSH